MKSATHIRPTTVPIRSAPNVLPRGGICSEGTGSGAVAIAGEGSIVAIEYKSSEVASAGPSYILRADALYT